VLTAADLQEPLAAPGAGQLSRRERELVTLVAQGRTDAQIAGLLFISIRIVRSHLDRIRDKTRCRRRADLIRLVLQAAWPSHPPAGEHPQSAVGSCTPAIVSSARPGPVLTV
jgi:DNA-binding CsgD family transcriptional regulator